MVAENRRNNLEHKAVPCAPTLHPCSLSRFLRVANRWAHRLKVYVPNGLVFERLSRRSGRGRWRVRRGFPVRGILQFSRQLFYSLTHDFPRFEFHRRSRRNHETAPRFVRISANPRFRQAWLKDPGISQFHCHIISKAVGNVIQGALNNIENLVLDHASLVADRHHNVPFS